jgi:hypothetical protein
VSELYGGSCLCGKVRYQFDVEPKVTVACHCSMCRKATGSVFATWTLVAKDHFRWTAGTDEIGEFNSSEHGQRFFCKRCGTTLGNLTTKWPQFMNLAAGTLDQAPDLKIKFHAYVGSKAPWYAITDSCPRFDQLPDSSKSRS